MELVHECDNCGWTGSEDELGCCFADMENLFERLDPGCVCPSGDCPECGACCYPLDEVHYRNAAAVEMLAILKAVDGPLLAKQRAFLLTAMTRSPEESELRMGLMNFLDRIADELHDKHGVECLIKEAV